MAEIEIVRDLGEILKSFADVKKEMSATKDELASVNRGLRLDSNNVELLARRSELLGRQLEENRQKSEVLSEAISELNRIKAESGQLDATQEKQLANFIKQQKDAEVQIIALTGATQHQVEANQAAEESTKSFSQSMTEFQSNLRAVNQVMGGVSNAFKLFGGDSDSAMGKAIAQGQQAVRMMSGIASMGKLLGKSNSDLANTFNTVAMSVGAAFAAFQIASEIINAFGEENREAASTVMIVAGALVAASIAAASLMGFTRPWMLPVALAGIGAAAAGIVALTKTSPASSGVATVADYDLPSAAAIQPQSRQTIDINLSVMATGSTVISQTNAEILSKAVVKEINLQLGKII